MIKQLVERNRAADERCPHAGDTWQRIEWVVGFCEGARGDNAREGSTTEYYEGFLSGLRWIGKRKYDRARDGKISTGRGFAGSQCDCLFSIVSICCEERSVFSVTELTATKLRLL
ncbi:hypothetical protein KR51_00030780 [Rubidibacter lacunae KORDI 51-2]|uniref:Uncharacterized protein n=1 Tax=Rubidibacter lacunae KORDI 51-2 TaxID=582515 RepID=U5DLD8_9CHRO|nr:hypothetical protein KR51_00030780 [Rubidibacter lacunae KORDI 51-2]